MSAELAIAAGIAKEVGSLDKLLRNIMSVDFMFKDNLNKRRIRKVIERLEYIYFSQDGVRHALEMLRDKKIRSVDQRDDLIGKTEAFYNDNPTAHEAIGDLESFFSSTRAALKLGEDFTQITMLVVYVKTAIRDAIQRLFEELSENNFSKNAIDAASGEATDILSSIATLNDGIQLVYRKLNA